MAADFPAEVDPWLTFIARLAAIEARLLQLEEDVRSIQRASSARRSDRVKRRKPAASTQPQGSLRRGHSLRHRT